ncbi:MAG: hypothetical protein ABIQ06_06330, partial [Caldimonas sp.]
MTEVRFIRLISTRPRILSPSGRMESPADTTKTAEQQWAISRNATRPTTPTGVRTMADQKRQQGERSPQGERSQQGQQKQSGQQQ